MPGATSFRATSLYLEKRWSIHAAYVGCGGHSGSPPLLETRDDVADEAALVGKSAAEGDPRH